MLWGVYCAKQVTVLKKIHMIIDYQVFKLGRALPEVLLKTAVVQAQFLQETPL